MLWIFHDKQTTLDKPRKNDKQSSNETDFFFFFFAKILVRRPPDLPDLLRRHCRVVLKKSRCTIEPKQSFPVGKKASKDDGVDMIAHHVLSSDELIARYLVIRWIRTEAQFGV